MRSLQQDAIGEGSDRCRLWFVVACARGRRWGVLVEDDGNLKAAEDTPRRSTAVVPIERQLKDVDELRRSILGKINPYLKERVGGGLFVEMEGGMVE